MTLAYTMAAGRGNTAPILEGLAATLTKRGLRCCGTGQINTERSDESPCDVDVRALPDGPVLRVSQSLGPSARGCRIDPAALDVAVGLVEARLAAGADLLIIKKFAEHDADAAYRSGEMEAKLRARKLRSHIPRKGRRGKPLTAQAKGSNRTKSRARARVEHVFGAQTNDMGGTLVRMIGLVRARARTGLKNLACNMRRLTRLRRPTPCPA